MLLHPDRGYPRVFINATVLNAYRTAAANAFATDLNKVSAGRDIHGVVVIRW